MNSIKNISSLIQTAATALFAANSIAVLMLLGKLELINLAWLNINFQQLLATHVEVAIMVWLPLAAFSAWAKEAKTDVRINQKLTRIVSIFFVLLIISGLMSESKSLMSDYYPLVSNPLFVFSMLSICLVVSMAALPALKIALAKKNLELSLSILTSLLAFLMVACGLVCWLFDAHNARVSFFWIGGHIFQLALVYTFCLFIRGSDQTARYSFIKLAVFCFPLLLHIGAMFYYFLFDTQVDGKDIFTRAMEVFIWWPLLVTIKPALKNSSPRFRSCLVVSLLLFFLAICFGIAIKPGTLLVPAHYHAVLAAINVAAFYYLIVNGVPLSTRSIQVYGVGMAILALGIGMAGILGEPRKVAIVDQAGIEQLVAFTFAGIGGMIALLASYYISFVLFKSGFMKKTATLSNYPTGIYPNRNHEFK